MTQKRNKRIENIKRKHRLKKQTTNCPYTMRNKTGYFFCELETDEYHKSCEQLRRDKGYLTPTASKVLKKTSNRRARYMKHEDCPRGKSMHYKLKVDTWFYD